MIPDHANPTRVPPRINPPESVVRPLRSLRSCMLHLDCDKADAHAQKWGLDGVHIVDSLDALFR